MNATFKLSRYVPTDYVVLKETPLGVVYYKDLVAIAYTGKRSKPTWHYRFSTVERMNQNTDEFFSRLESWEDMKKARSLARSGELDSIQVGDLFANSWGYDQTNVDFYQVIEKKKKSMVIRAISSIACNETTGGSMSDNVMPAKDHFLSDAKPILKTSLSMEHGGLYKTKVGEKHYRSWYA